MPQFAVDRLLELLVAGAAVFELPLVTVSSNAGSRMTADFHDAAVAAKRRLFGRACLSYLFAFAQSPTARDTVQVSTKGHAPAPQDAARQLTLQVVVGLLHSLVVTDRGLVARVHHLRRQRSLRGSDSGSALLTPSGGGQTSTGDDCMIAPATVLDGLAALQMLQAMLATSTASNPESSFIGYILSCVPLLSACSTVSSPIIRAEAATLLMHATSELARHLSIPARLAAPADPEGADSDDSDDSEPHGDR